MLRSLALLATSLTLTFAITGCKKPEYPACKKDKHCKSENGETCVDGSCQNCKEDTDCADKGEGLTCIDFRCSTPGEAGAGGAPGELNSPCTGTAECFGGLVCRQGTCQNCTDDVECSPGTCTPETQRCSAAGSCQNDDQCPIDEICDGGECIFPGDPSAAGDAPCGIAAVFFAFDSDRLTPKGQEDLKTLGTCVIEQNRGLILEAHADNVGTEEYNILLTERRGQTVKSFLVTLGVSEANLQVIAKGALQATGNTESERAKDRRVDFAFN